MLTAVVMCPRQAPKPRRFMVGSTYVIQNKNYQAFLRGPPDPIAWGDRCIVYVREDHARQGLAFNAMLDRTPIFGPMLVVADDSPSTWLDRGFNPDEAAEVVRVLSQLRREPCLQPPHVEPPFPAWRPTEAMVAKTLKALERGGFSTAQMTGKVRRMSTAAVPRDTRVEDWLRSLKRDEWDKVMSRLGRR
ncbi:hypothetical protein [Pendulispora rubella]